MKRILIGLLLILLIMFYASQRENMRDWLREYEQVMEQTTPTSTIYLLPYTEPTYPYPPPGDEPLLPYPPPDNSPTRTPYPTCTPYPTPTQRPTPTLAPYIQP